MREAGDVKPVPFAGVRHLRHLVAVGSVGQVVADGLVRAATRDHLDLIRRRYDHFLGHVADHLIHHEQYGNAELLREVESLDDEIEAFLRRVGAESDDLVVAMRSPARLHHVGLRGQRGQSRGWATPLHVDEHARRFGHSGVADVFHH